MNGFNFDYMDYLSGIPSNVFPDQGYMINGSTNYIVPNNENSLSNNATVTPYEGFIRGNLFDNLYEPYKNYNAQKLNPANEKDALLQQWQQYNFALVDLNLYLDVNPNDSNALRLYNEYLKVKKQLEEKFEASYGPIDVCSNNVGNGSWNWDNGPWPWEGDK